MHRSIKQVLHCYVSFQWGKQYLLLPTSEFALNSTYSACTGISLAHVLFSCGPTFTLEYAVCVVTDGPVQSVTDCIVNMESTLQLVRFAVTCSTAYMVDYTNQHCHEVTFAMDSYSWLSTNHFKLPRSLSQKLTFHYVGPFKFIEQIDPVAFHLLLTDGWKVHDVFYTSQQKPAIGFVPGQSWVTPSAFWSPVNDSGEFEVKDVFRFPFCTPQLLAS